MSVAAAATTVTDESCARAAAANDEAVFPDYVDLACNGGTGRLSRRARPGPILVGGGRPGLG